MTLVEDTGLWEALQPIDRTVAAMAPDIIAGWGVLQAGLVIVAVLIFISSAEDLLLDLCFWGFMAGWPIAWVRKPSSRRLRAIDERLAAILVPAWNESEVIGQMLRNTVEQMEYTRYHIFVGVYPNDPATQREVERMSEEFPNIHCVVVDNPGPTKKSDCLNQLIRNIGMIEAELGEKFQIYVNHDAEDVVHAFELKLMNWYTRENGMVQIPVFSLDRNPWQMIACHYMDEFSEWHTKDLVIRSALTGMTPSAGVGTAFNRAAMDALIRARNGQVFNPDSLTEDYDIAQFLFHLGFTSQFVRYQADMHYLDHSVFHNRVVIRTKPEMVATHEFFPDKFRTAVRQKARWMQGICFQGWQQIGWQGRWIDRYFLWRDRKQLFTAPTAALAYLLFFAVLVTAAVSYALPSFPKLPPPVAAPWVWDIILINLLFMLNRLFHRALFVGWVHGVRHVFLSPVRAVIGNLVGFFAFARALRQFFFSRLMGRTIKWDKTTHAYPTMLRHSGAGAHKSNGGSDKRKPSTKTTPPPGDSGGTRA